MLWLAWTAAISFSPTPLRASFVLGFLIAAIGGIQAVNAVIRSILGLYVVPGWSSLVIVTCLIGGAILISIGVLGEYVGRIFEAAKERPLYLIASKFNCIERSELNTAESSSDPVVAQLAAFPSRNVPEKMPASVGHEE
jgi:hypothetical protein